MVSHKNGTDLIGVERVVGHYRAYGTNGVVIWEQKVFAVGVDMVPYGVSQGMKAMTITADKKIVRKWDPWSLLPKK